ncbi:MAG: NTP transferase domain-containing protein [Verrucomicrobiota bacterium]|nr:NTP transferase domain-containing protein [Verrucomicrobiota bacterium]
MAGAGSRLGNAGGAIAKPLVQIGGRPLICYALDALARAGVRTVHAVMGANSERLADALRPLIPPTMEFHVIVNPEWQKQNGVSVLAAAPQLQSRFFLTMGDHLFEYAILESLFSSQAPGALKLAVDRKIDSVFDLDDAMKVQTDGDRIVAIAKDLPRYDAIDTGVFLCSPEIFSYLERAKRNGDCSLADGVRLMAADGKAHAVDIAGAWWQDVDTPEMLARAEQESARLLRDGRSGLPQESVAGERRADG